MENLDQIVNALWLTKDLHWDLALYWLFLINLVLLMIQPEGSAFATMLGIGVLVAVVIDKTYAFGYMFDPGVYSPETYHRQIFIGTYLIRVLMFVAPLTIAGSTRDGKVRAFAILAGISGAVYMFARWYFDQRDTADVPVAFVQPQMLAQHAGIVLVLAPIALRNRFRPFVVHREVPGAVTRDFAADDIKV